MVKIQILKYLPGAKKSKRGGSKGDVSGGATARGAMEKGGCVRITEGQEVRGDDPIKYFSAWGSEVTLEPQSG